MNNTYTLSNQLIRVLFLPMLLAGAWAGDSGGDPSLEAAKSSYAKKVEGIEAKAEQDKAKAKAELDAAYQAAIKRAMAKGDLNEANTIKSEMDAVILEGAAIPSLQGEINFETDVGIIGNLPKEAFTASSMHANLGPWLARMSAFAEVGNSWHASAAPQDEWIAVNLGKPETVAAISTRGRGKADCYVREFKLYASIDGKRWMQVPHPQNKNGIFMGNGDDTSVNGQRFIKSVRATLQDCASSVEQPNMHAVRAL